MKRLLLLVLSICLAGIKAQAVDACITVPASYTVTAKTVYICKGTWINLTANDCSNSTPPGMENYSWVNLSNPGTPYLSKTISIPDSGKWEVTFTNMSDWSVDKDTMYVRFYSQPTFQINGATNVITKCDNVPTALTASTHANFSSYNWYITGNPTSLGTATSLTITSVPGGSQFYAATAYYSVTGCTVSDTIFVTTFPTPEPYLGKDTTLCAGQTLILMPDSLTTHRKNYQFRWYNSASFLNNDSTRTITTSGQYFLTMRGPNPYTCLGSDTINVTFTPLPTVSAGSAATICYADNIAFTDATASGGGGGPFSYAWSPKATLSDSTILNPTANPLSTTTYTLKVTANNCSSTATRTVTVNPQLLVSTPFTDTTLCKGDSINLAVNVSGGTPYAGPSYNYSWSPTTGMRAGHQSIATPKVSPTTPTNYTVVVSDQRNCQKTISVNVDNLWIKTPISPKSITAQTGDLVKIGFYNQTHNGFSYRIKDAVGNVLSTDSVYMAQASDNSSRYYVEVYHPITNCFVVDSIDITFVDELVQKIYVPTAFNPDMISEPKNANLRVFGNNVSDAPFLFRIYNKWGELVYETNSFSTANIEGWNGTINNTGTPLNSGVYTYTVSGQFLDGSSFEKTGTASLIR